MTEKHISWTTNKVFVDTLNDYQSMAHTTANKDLDADTALTVSALGLTGESGEVADLIKKWRGHGHTLDVDKLQKELGDVLWYVAETATLIGLSLKEVAETNLTKLAARYPSGFSEWYSKNRKANDE